MGLSVTKVIFFVSKNPIEKSTNVEDAANFFYFHRKFEVDANENETSCVF